MLPAAALPKTTVYDADRLDVWQRGVPDAPDADAGADAGGGTVLAGAALTGAVSVGTALVCALDVVAGDDPPDPDGDALAVASHPAADMPAIAKHAMPDSTRAVE